jgi:two-component system nitrogen regulation response regulator GlnG
MPHLLIIDDEPSILHAFRRTFRDPDVTLSTASTAAEGLDAAARVRPDVVIQDINLPDQSGLECFRALRRQDARVPVVFITGHGTMETAVEAMKLGAFEYLLKPLELDQLREVVAAAFEVSRAMRVPAVVAEQEPAPEPADVLVGRCPAMQEVYKAIGRVAAQDVTVLILGETGTGKELVARALYQHSRRAAAPFLAVNCAAIPETLLESELFGHEKGAFTGAERKRIGKFEQCSGGTLFLDEVADLSPLTQAKLLRVLQERQFERLGGNETVAVDVRLIAATNRDLDELVGEGRFRRDLYYRLNVFAVRLPPLRERGEDLSLLVDYYVRRFARELGKDVQRAAPEAVEVLYRYLWPGNVRELQAALKQALLRATGPVLLPGFLPGWLRPAEAAGAAAPAGTTADWEQLVADALQAGSTGLYAQALTLMERALLTRVLRHTGGNQLQAAKILGITRGSLRTKLRALGIRVGRSVEDEGRAPQDPGA